MPVPLIHKAFWHYMPSLCIKMQKIYGLNAYSLHIFDNVPTICRNFAPEN